MRCRIWLVFVMAAVGACTGHKGPEPVRELTIVVPRLMRTIALPGVGVPAGREDSAGIPGRLDHLAYDADRGLLFIAALEQGSLEVVDVVKGERIRRVMGLREPQGVAVVQSTGCVVVACGGEGAVHVYSLADFSERGVVSVGDDADNVRVSPGATVYVGFGGDGGSGGLAVVDTETLKKTSVIPLPAHPESFQLDRRPGHGEIYANLPGLKRANSDGTVAVVDSATGAMRASYRLAGAARNFPMALDSERGRLLIACRKPAKLLCLDCTTGAVLGESPCVADSDDLFYDAATSRVLVIGGGQKDPDVGQEGDEAALDVFQVDDAGSLRKASSAPTAPHARTGWFVPERHTVYVVAPPSNGQDARVLEFKVDK